MDIGSMDSMKSIKKDGRGSGSKANVGRKKRPDTKVVAVRLPLELVQAHGINASWIKEAIDLKLNQESENKSGEHNE